MENLEEVLPTLLLKVLKHPLLRPGRHLIACLHKKGRHGFRHGESQTSKTSKWEESLTRMGLQVTALLQTEDGEALPLLLGSQLPQT